MQHDAHATTTLVASILNIRRDDPWKRSGALQSPPALDTPRGDQMVLACNSSNIIDVLLVWITSIIGRDDRAINARTRIALFPIRRTNVCRANPFFPTPPLPFFFYIPRSGIILRECYSRFLFFFFFFTTWTVFNFPRKGHGRESKYEPALYLFLVDDRKRYTRACHCFGAAHSNSSLYSNVSRV